MNVSLHSVKNKVCNICGAFSSVVSAQYPQDDIFVDQCVQLYFLFGSVKKANISLEVYVSFLSGCSHPRAGMSQVTTVPSKCCNIHRYLEFLELLGIIWLTHDIFQHKILTMQFLPFGLCIWGSVSLFSLYIKEQNWLVIPA